ncbi:hypothetical protein O3P69_009222 [Scylla paramamosain]|uniref:Uncharacterized protein n=1 Tax=Scylla paramamosain TaxID=85552 RepID=A0AAW0TAC4_SCYPA
MYTGGFGGVQRSALICEACWPWEAAWVCWVGLTMFAMLKLCKYHQQENIRVSMARERARLVSDRHSQISG